MNRFICIIFVVWRVSLLMMAFLAPLVIPVFGAKFPYWRELLVSTNLPSWLWSFGNFDGVHYLTIAQRGYAAQFTQAFFPLYPLSMRLVAAVLNKNTFLAGFFISNASTLLFLMLFAKLLHEARFSARSIQWTIIFTLVFPFSFFFGSIYNESFFLCFVIGSFLAARKNRWLLAGLFGMLASFTRFVGIFLLPALLVESWQQREFRINPPASRCKALRAGNSELRIISLLLIPLGLLLYMAYLGFNFNDPLYFIHAQPIFGASRSGGEIILLPQVIWRYIRIFITVPYANYDFWVAMWEFSATLVFLLIMVFNWQKIPLSEAVFSLLAVLTPTLTGTLSSMPRYVLVAFPLFYVHGLIKARLFRVGLLMVYATLLMVFTALFTRGYWVS